MNFELTNIPQVETIGGNKQSPKNRSPTEIVFKKRKRKKKTMHTPPQNSLLHQVSNSETKKGRIRKRMNGGETEEIERNTNAKKFKNISQAEIQNYQIPQQQQQQQQQKQYNMDHTNLSMVTSPSFSSTMSMIQPNMMYQAQSPHYQNINSPYAFSSFTSHYVPPNSAPMTNQQYQLQQQQAMQLQLLQYQQMPQVQLQQQPPPPLPQPRFEKTTTTSRRKQMKPSDILIFNTEVKPPLSPEPLPKFSSKKRRRKGKGKDSEYIIPDWDDDDGNYVFSEKEMLNNRYEVVKYIGHGTFSLVLHCLDHENSMEPVAVKIVRSFPRYVCSAKNEINILKEIQMRDHVQESCIVNLIDSFSHKGHICLVFPKLGCSIYDFISYYHFYGLSSSYVQKIAKQLLTSVAFLHDKLHIIHTDIKPENMMLVSGEARYEGMTDKNIVYMPVNTSIKLIDFGSATYYKEGLKCTISTRHYRAPEVILNLVWSFSADMWSVGCILYELYCGKALFQTRQDAQHLAMMEKYLGPIPESLWNKADDATLSTFYNSTTAKLRWPELAKDEKAIRKVQQLENMQSVLNAEHPGRHYQLYDLIRKLLKYEASERLSAKEALSHPFFKCKFT